jgi:hypothetical protein
MFAHRIFLGVNPSHDFLRAEAFVGTNERALEIMSRSADASNQSKLTAADRSVAIFLLAPNPRVAGSNPAVPAGRVGSENG